MLNNDVSVKIWYYLTIITNGFSDIHENIFIILRVYSFINSIHKL